MNILVERRASAPHPGPVLKREFFDTLSIDVAGFAVAAGLDYGRLSEILAGRASIDVDSAIRLARALQLSAETLMRMQTRADFALARGNPGYSAVPVVRPQRMAPFPESDFAAGRLGRTEDGPGNASYFFAADVVGRGHSDDYPGFHALFRGDMLRVYDPAGDVLWTGPVLHGLDEKMMLPFVRSSEWPLWFAGRYRADLALGEEHQAFFRRMSA